MVIMNKALTVFVVSILFLAGGSRLALSTHSRSRPTHFLLNVNRERRVIAGYDEPNTPPHVSVSDGLRAAITDPAAIRDGRVNLNQAVYVRFFAPERTRAPRNILILVPGIVAGANVFSALATELVARSGGELEVWAVDRRSNLLEDATAMVQAETERTSNAALAALGFYKDDVSGRGGYIANHPFELSRMMAEWGLDVHLRDLKAIVDEARRVGEGTPPKIFLGGYDFVGADMAALFAAYDFDGTAGFTLIDGIVLLEGTPSVAASPRAPQVRTDEEYLDTGVVLQGTLAIPGLRRLRDPQVLGDAPFSVGSPFEPFSFQLVEVLAQLAVFAPSSPSPLPDDLAPAVPSTNAATLAVNIDDEFAEQAQRRFSVGFLKVPAGGTLADVAVSRPDPDRANPNGLFAARDLGVDGSGDIVLQRWDGLNDLTGIGLRGKEVSNLAGVAQGFFYGAGDGTTRLGEANSIEWFFPQRLLLDILLVARLDSSRLSGRIVQALTERGDNPLTVTENRRVNLPVLALSTEEGIFAGETRPLPTVFAFFPYRNSISTTRFTGKEIPGYAHNDILWSTEPLVADMIIDFINGI